MTLESKKVRCWWLLDLIGYSQRFPKKEELNKKHLLETATIEFPNSFLLLTSSKNLSKALSGLVFQRIR